MLKSYMHGYFMELRAYEKLVLSNDPFAYEKFKKDQVEKRLSKQRERIQVNKKKSGFDAEVKVNQKFVDELIAQNTSNKKKKQNTDVEALMTDDRFKVMFEDNEFKRDVNSIEYKTRPVSETFQLFSPAFIDKLFLFMRIVSGQSREPA